MNYLVLLRHGQSQWNLENRFTGFRDIDLSEDGEKEAALAGEKLAQFGVRFNRAFTSTLKRAYKTAEIALTNSGQPELIQNMTRHDDLRERNYGDLSGQNKDEARAQFGQEQVQIWRRSYDVQPPGGESLQDVVERRVRPYYESQIGPFLEQGENVLITAHGNSLRAILLVLEQETPESINQAEIPTGLPLVFELEKNQVQKRYFIN